MEWKCHLLINSINVNWTFITNAKSWAQSHLHVLSQNVSTVVSFSVSTLAYGILLTEDTKISSWLYILNVIDIPSFMLLAKGKTSSDFQMY